MEADPDETTNLLYEEPSAEILKAKEDLKDRLISYEERYGLEGYVEQGQFAVYEEFKGRAYRENNPPIFPKGQEGKYISLEEEVKRAVEYEEVVNLEELDISYFIGRGTLRREELWGQNA